MSYQEKRILTSIAAGILVLTAYCLYAFNPDRLASIAPGDLKQWATTMLMFIGIGVVIMIIVQIVFHILYSVSVAVTETIRNGEKSEAAIDSSIRSEMVEDERDRLIELKANRVGFAIAGIGFVAALMSLVLNYSPVVMLNILFIALNLGSIVEGMVQLFYYWKGPVYA